MRSASARAAPRSMPWCSRMDSPIWSATVNTGLSEVIGSWKIIAISAPRMPRIVAPWARVRSAREPSRRAKSMLPPVMRPPPCSTSRMIDSAVTDLPEPDSPTIATVSPRPTSKETPRTAYNAVGRRELDAKTVDDEGASVCVVLQT